MESKEYGSTPYKYPSKLNRKAKLRIFQNKLIVYNYLDNNLYLKIYTIYTINKNILNVTIIYMSDWKNTNMEIFLSKVIIDVFK